ncbi:glycosyltransferase family 2 protein [Rodentibacter caecimuris]|uniref:Glycosyltransferase n=1 Tax=Rodentibacter caecimuris TaxID=1796644 RepID=A0ABX3KV21_9PAST|nr:glycosyltransferase [Rodentibacter heylii]
MFSIIVPSFNRPNEITNLLADLEKQTNYNFEVIIVDDCSIQPVTLNKKYPFDVKLIRNNINLGAAESRNIGARNASQDWLLFLDDDDRFMPNKCEVLINIIQQHNYEKINFIYHPAKCKMVNEHFTYVTKPFKNPKDITKENILLSNKIGGMPMVAITKAMFLKVGGLSVELRSLEDYDFLLKLICQKDFKPYYVDETLTFCTFHTKRSSVSTDTKNTELALDYICQRYVKTEKEKENFTINKNYILAYPYIMNLSRIAARYYFAIFKRNRKIKSLIIVLAILISPKLAINLKRFI